MLGLALFGLEHGFDGAGQLAHAQFRLLLIVLDVNALLPRGRAEEADDDGELHLRTDGTAGQQLRRHQCRFAHRG